MIAMRNSTMQYSARTQERLNVADCLHFGSRLFCLTSLSLILGCASVTATRTGDGDHETKGLRYWLPMPYLLAREPIIASQKDYLFRIDVKKNVWTQIEPVASAVPAPKEMHQKPARAGKPEEKKEGSKNEGDAAQPAAPLPFAPLEVIYLPDYCHQYALQMTSNLATLNADVTFGDGWKLLGLNSKADSTVLVGKVLDVIAAIKAGVAPVAAEPGKPEDEDTQKALSEFAAAAPSKDAYLYVKKSVIKRLKPGIYPIFKRGAATVPKDGEKDRGNQASCNAVPHFDIETGAILGIEEISYSIVQVTPSTFSAPPSQ